MLKSEMSNDEMQSRRWGSKLEVGFPVLNWERKVREGLTEKLTFK